MKKTVAIILVLVMVFGLSGCGIIEKLPIDLPGFTEETEPTSITTTENEPATEATEPATEATEPATGATEPVTEATEKNYPYVGQPIPWMFGTFTLVGAELVEEGINTAVFRYYYDFTNTSEKSLRPQENIAAAVYQNGELCTYAWTELEDDFADKYQISDLLVRPGCTVRCMEQFEIDPGLGEVEIMFSTSGSEESITVYFDPADLPGVPEEFELEPIPDPTWTDVLFDGGVYNGDYYVYIDRGEIVEGVDGERILRVYFDFTNNSAEEASFWMNSLIHAYQDGLELRSGYPLTYVDEDNMYYEFVAPGETISVSVCFELRGSSNVEIELENYVVEGGANLGCDFIIAEE